MLVIAAVLTAIAIANVNSCALHRRLATIPADVNIVTQADDRRDGKNRRRRVENIITVVFLDKDCATKPETYRTSNADGTKRLVRKVQK